MATSTQKLIAQCQDQIGLSYLATDQLNESLLNGFVRQVLQGYMYKKHPKTLKDSLLLDTIVMLSIVACSRRVKIQPLKGGLSIYPNIYAIKIMPSSSGKDLPLSLAQSELLDAVQLDLESRYRKFTEEFEKAPFYYLPFIDEDQWNGLGKTEKKELIRTNRPSDFTFSFDEGTLEGFVSQCASIQMFKKGAAFCKMNEFGSYILGAENDSKRAFLTGLMKAYDVQEFGGKVIKGSKQVQTVANVPVILLGNTSSRWIKEDKDKDVLMKFVGGGLGRRSFIFYPRELVVESEEASLEEVLENRQRDYDIAKEWTSKIRNEILNKYDSTPFHTTFKFSDKASQLVETYSLYGELKYDTLINDQEAVASEYRGRSWKMVRLAGLFAWLNHPDKHVIEFEDVQEGIYFTQYIARKTSQFIYDTDNIMLPEEKLLRFLVNNPGQHLKTEIRKRDFIPYHRPVREYKELFANTQELGREQGYQIFVEDEGNRFSIEARILEDTDPNRIPIMIAPTEGKDFREIASNTSYDYHVTKWKDLHKVVKQYAYMPQLNNGKRAKKNAIAGGVLLGLDVDDHWTLKEARKWLKEKQLQSLIITTPSHQKSVSKDGKKIEPKDKFRILILLNHPFNATAQEWSQVVENFSEEIGSVTDTSCKDISRFFFPSPDDATYYYIDGKPLDWTEYNYSHEVKDTPKLKLTDPLEKAIAYANEKYGVVSKGGRDTFLNEIWHWNRKHEGLGRQQTYDICRALNQRFCNPPFDEEYMKKWDRDE